METNQLRFILEELRFSEALPAEEIVEIAEGSSMRSLVAGEFLFREGRSNHDLYLVRRGLVALEMQVPQRGAVRILTVGPGEMIGWSALLDQGRMTTSAVATEDTELVVSPAQRLQELCQSNGEFGYHLMHRMAEALSKRLVATRLQLLDLFADTATGIQSERPA